MRSFCARSFYFFAVLLFSAALSGTCLAGEQRVSMTTADGQSVSFTVSRTKSPDRVSNEWIRDATVALSVNVDQDKGMGTMGYEISFEPRVEGITSVRVSDVTVPPEVLVLDDKAPEFREGLYYRISEPIEISPQTLPWFYEKRMTIKIFKFVITGPEGETKTLYQPALYREGDKRLILKMMGQSSR
jgi:hypothetical protein